MITSMTIGMALAMQGSTIKPLPEIVQDKTFNVFGYKWIADSVWNGNHAYDSTGASATTKLINLDISKTSWADFTKPDGSKLRIKQATRVVLSQKLGYGTYEISFRGVLHSFDPGLIAGCWLIYEDAVRDPKKIREVTIWESGAWGDENNPYQHYITLRGPLDEVLGQAKFAARKFVRYDVKCSLTPSVANVGIDGVYADGRKINVAWASFNGDFSDQMVFKSCLLYPGKVGSTEVGPVYTAVRDQGSRTMDITSFKFTPLAK